MDALYLWTSKVVGRSSETNHKYYCELTVSSINSRQHETKEDKDKEERTKYQEIVYSDAHSRKGSKGTDTNFVQWRDAKVHETINIPPHMQEWSRTSGLEQSGIASQASIL